MSKRNLGFWLLVLAGSGVDAIVILGFNVLTAAQTGNTILFAVALARGDFTTGLASAVSIVSFICGAVVGGWLCRDGRVRRALFGELFLLLAAFGIWSVWGADLPSGHFIIAGVALAMGVQSAVIVRIHGHPSTYITGLLTSFAVALSAPRKPGGPSAVEQGLVWILYLSGAVLTGVVYRFAGPAAVFVPVAALGAAAWVASGSATDGDGANV